MTTSLHIDPVTGWLAAIGVLLMVAFALFPAFAMALGRLRVSSRWDRRVFLVAALFAAHFAGSKVALHIQSIPPWMSTAQGYVPDEATNDFGRIVFEWTGAPSAVIPADAPIYIDAAPHGTTNFARIVEAVYGDRSNVVDTSSWTLNPTSYVYRMTSPTSPTVIDIRDFAVVASETSRHVRVSFTAPTNFFEAVARVQARMRDNEALFADVSTFVVRRTNNVVTIDGDFISRGIDREFRAIVEKDMPSGQEADQ